MRKIITTLLNIGSDKYLHLIVCLIISSVIAQLSSWGLAVAVTALVGIGKETYDELSYGGWSWKDILADALGITLGLLIALL